MARVCYFTGKRTRAGRSIARRGKAKYLGGVGRKVTGITKRAFKPNIQKVRAVVDGKVVLTRVDPFDAAYHAALSTTLEEWDSPEDDEAFKDL